MDERDLEPEEPFARRGVDQVCARALKLRERRPEVADLVGDVMHSGPPLREEAADRGVLRQRLEELDAALADPERRRAHALVVDRRPVLDLGPEQPLVRVECLFEVADGDAEMMNAARFHPREANGTG